MINVAIRTLAATDHEYLSYAKAWSTNHEPL